MLLLTKWLISIAAILVGLVAKPQKIFFEQLTTAEGLPSDYVNCVFRDSKGSLWIGTDKGACRFDGKNFLYLNKDNGLASNFVYCISGGVTWSNATQAPTLSNAELITIRNPHVVTVSASTVVKKVVLENGALLNVAAGTLFITN